MRMMAARPLLGYSPWWLREVTWLRVGALFAFCIVLTVSMPVPMTVESFPGLFRFKLLSLAPGLILVLIAEAWDVRGWRQWLLSAAALGTGAWLAMALRCAVDPEWFMTVSYEFERVRICDSGTFAAIRRNPNAFLLPIVMGAIFLMMHRGLQRDAELESFLRKATQRRVVAQRRRLDAELQGLQARVEPEFLFAAIAAIRDRCVADPASVQPLLERLIEHLRAALPRVEGERSTLGHELRVVQSWLEVRALAAATSSRAAFHVTEEAQRAAFPPMILLPLVSLLATTGGDGFRLQGRAGGGKVSLAFTLPAPMPTPAAIAQILARLETLYDQRASLRWADGVPMELLLEVPHEPGDGDHR